MIRRLGTIVALVAAASLALAAPAGANHTLTHRVALLTAKLNCLQKYPVFAFSDYAYYQFGTASVPVMTSEAMPQEVNVLVDNQEITALDFNYGPSMGQSDAFLLGVKPTSSCKARFPTAPNPVSFARIATTTRMLRLR
jgi:hypothetical protein